MRQIDSPQNPVVKAAAKLRTRRGRDTQQRLIIDGLREVLKARQSGLMLEEVFCLSGAKVDFKMISSFGVELFSLSQRAFEKVAFGKRAEIVATAQMPTRKLEQLTLPHPATIAVLEGFEKPGNVGAVMRSADAAGIDAVILVEPITDLFNPNAIRASLGTIFSLRVATAAFHEYTAWASDLELKHYLAKCEEAADYTNVDFRQPCAIVLGSEATGLREHWNQLRNTKSVAIPMLGTADSLNVSAAAAVLFYEVLRQRSQETCH